MAKIQHQLTQQLLTPPMLLLIAGALPAPKGPLSAEQGFGADPPELVAKDLIMELQLKEDDIVEGAFRELTRPEQLRIIRFLDRVKA